MYTTQHLVELKNNLRLSLNTLQKEEYDWESLTFASSLFWLLYRKCTPTCVSNTVQQQLDTHGPLTTGEVKG